jgi:hypothetical protein
MVASDNISPHQFKLKHESYGGGHWEDASGQSEASKGEPIVPVNYVEHPVSQGSHMITAHAGKGTGKALGMLTWTKGVIQKISVNENQQHKGMATQMYEHAKTITPGLAHSNNRTDAGEGWAKAVGGPRPPRMQDDPSNQR